LLGALAAVAVTAVGLSGCASDVPPPGPGAVSGHIRAHAGRAPSGARLSTAAPAPAPARSSATTTAATVITEPGTESVLLVPAHPRGALAVFVHGSGQSHEAILEDGHDRDVAQELVRHGYLVLA